MPTSSLEKDVLDRFGYDNFMWVVVWGGIHNLQPYMRYEKSISLPQLNAAIAAASYMCYMAKSTEAEHFLRVTNMLKDFRNTTYPDAWSNKLSNIGDKLLEVSLSPLDWVSNSASNAVIEISTDTSLTKLIDADVAANTNDDLKLPVFVDQTEVIGSLAVGLQHYFQQELDRIDGVIISVQTELEKEYELQKRLNLMKKWDDLIKPLYKNNDLLFCDKVQQYLQQKNISTDKQEVLNLHAPLNIDAKREMLFNAPQPASVGVGDLLLEQAKIISYNLKNKI